MSEVEGSTWFLRFVAGTGRSEERRYVHRGILSIVALVKAIARLQISSMGGEGFEAY